MQLSPGKFTTEVSSVGYCPLNKTVSIEEGEQCEGRGDARECQELRNVIANEKRYGRYAVYCAIGDGAALAILAATWLAWDDSSRVAVACHPSTQSAAFTINGAFDRRYDDARLVATKRRQC